MGSNNNNNNNNNNSNPLQQQQPTTKARSSPGAFFFLDKCAIPVCRLLQEGSLLGFVWIFCWFCCCFTSLAHDSSYYFWGPFWDRLSKCLDQLLKLWKFWWFEDTPDTITIWSWKTTPNSSKFSCFKLETSRENLHFFGRPYGYGVASSTWLIHSDFKMYL